MDNRPIKVLLIEDNQNDARLLREMLAEASSSCFSLQHTDRISSGLDILSSNEIHVVLLNLNLPDAQGLDTLQNVFIVAPKVPVVVISDEDNEGLALRSVQGGAQDYLVKEYTNSYSLTRAIRNAIERKRAEEELRKSNRALKTLSDCNQALVRARNEGQLLQDVCQILVNTGGYRLAWVGYAEQNEARTVRPVSWAGYDEGYLASLNITWADTEDGRGPTGTAVRTGKMVKATSIPDDASFAPWRSTAAEHGFAASIALPLIGNGKPFGALNIYTRRSDAFDQLEENLLQELSEDLAYGILALRNHTARALAEDELQKSEERYRLLFNTMLDGFALHEIICDENGKPCDYRFLEVNPAFERMTGLKSSQIIGKTVMQVLPATEASWVATYGEVALTGKSIRFENFTQSLNKHFEVVAFSPHKHQFATLITDFTERKKVEKVQDAIYKISEMSVSTTGLEELYQSIHAILAGLMPVDNFYIALYDPLEDLVSFPYYVDQYDPPAPPQKPGHGLTEYVLRTGESLLASPEIFDQLIQQGEVELVGINSVDWLGVPLKAGGRVIGVMVTQTYTEGIRFRLEEKELLEFVSTQVALAIQRKHTEEALRQSEERYRTLLDNTPDFIFSLDRVGRYTAVNQSFCQAINLNWHEIIGKNHHELGFPESIALEWQAMNQRVLSAGEVVQTETSLPMPGGNLRTYEVNFRPILDLDGQISGVWGTSRDITERKLAEDALHASQEFTRNIIDSSLDMIIAVDQERKVIEFNKAAQETFGYSLQEILGQKVDILYADAAHNSKIKTTIASEGHVNREILNRRKNGEVFPSLLSASVLHNSRGETIGVMGVSREITAQKRAEERIRRDVERSQNLAELSQLIVKASLDDRTTMDIVTRRVAEIMQDTCVITLVADDGLSTAPAAYFHPNPQILPLVAELLHSGQEQVAGEAVNCTIQSGQPVLVPVVTVDQVQSASQIAFHSLLFVPLRAQSRVIGALGVARDRIGQPYVQDDLVFLEHIADRTAFAITNARLYRQEQERSKELSVLFSLSTRMRQLLSTEEILPVVLNEVQHLFDASAGMIILQNSAREDYSIGLAVGQLADNTGRKFRLEESLGAEYLRTSQTFVTADYAGDPSRLLAISKAENIGPAIFAPMQSEIGLIGILMIARERSQEVRAFSPAEVNLFTTIAELTGNTLRRTRLFDEAQRRLKHVQALREIDIAITGSVDLRVSLKTILEQVLSQMNVDAACVLLLNPYTQTLEYGAGRGFRTNAMQHTRLRLGEGYAGQAALGRRAVHVAELNTRKTDFLRSPFFSSEGFITYFAVPLIAKSQVRGVLEIFHRSQLNPDHEWLDFLDALAGQAAIAIDNTSLFDDLQRSNQELILAYDATIEGWSRALDLRDKETEGHTQRVNDLTVQIARSMGYSEGELIHVRRGALLHDIGKMGIPDNILLKPGPLTREEWIIMRKHPVYAYEMLSPITYLRPALDIPYCHHEKWDGSGYPRGLKGEQIPLAARIFSIVDVWDALISDRPYRAAWPKAKAWAYIQEQSGTHFYPQALSVFVQTLKEKFVF